MKTTVATLKKMKEENNKITMLTCYDYSTAKLMDAVGVEILLVGDSLGNTMLGYENTLPVTMEEAAVSVWRPSVPMTTSPVRPAMST